MQASVQRMPGPPAFVTIATREPRGHGLVGQRPAPARTAPPSTTRAARRTARAATPPRRRAPTSDPVCEDAARAPAAVRPALTTMTGFLRVTRRAICGEAARIAEGLQVHEDRLDVGVVLPVLEQVVARRRRSCSPSRRTSRRRVPISTASARIASPSAPDCETKPTLPRGRERRGEGGVQAHLGFGVDDPHAVGADHAHAVAASAGGLEVRLEARAPSARPP